ncbi:ABC transporter ATP-binding protein [Geobacter sp. SVR]|uniref:ABC transporter ATP-binding protein n=1 Tax=Geobacter sp. SVR TaxID=2495594 RepID=UPI00143EFD0D|nr:ABC transporter ATP-binding protein [Geobacter sp. SVR]
MIELSHVTKTFNTGKSNQFTAVDDVCLTVEPGRVTILKGPSGSGKTSLLALIGCMARPTSGRIRLHGIRPDFLPERPPEEGLDISSLPERFLTGIRRSAFGFIFQQFNLVRGISVLENIMLPAYPTGESHAACRSRAMELLELFALSRQAASRVEWLSGGELQRAAIARALINNPAVIIADEPTAHLDSTLSREFMAIVGTFREQGRTVLIASHDPIVFDSPLADRVVEMRDGRIIGSGGTP